MADDSWRCFIAVRLGDAHRSALADCVALWSRHPDLTSLRWTDPASWHVTLAFLGSTAPGDVSRIVEAGTSATAGTGAIRMTTAGLGAFPDASRARVAWQGIDDDGRLGEVAAALRSSLGLRAQSPFRPHLTLARARGRPADLRRWLADPDPPAPRISLTATEAVLFRSHLGREAPRHEELAAFALEGGVLDQSTRPR